MVEWEGSSLMTKKRFISYLRAQKLVSKGCLYHLVRVKDSNFGGPSLQPAPVICEFLKVFPDDLPSIFLDRVIDIWINIL